MPEKEYRAKPVEWTKDGYPVFTDQFQFYKWEKERRQEIAEEIQDIVNEKAFLLVQESLKDEFKRFDDKFIRIEKKLFPEDFEEPSTSWE